jgi:cell wall-associated NlpC family hydrolase
MRASVAALIVLGLAACAAAPPQQGRPASPVGSSGTPSIGSARVANPARLLVANALSMLGQPYRYGGDMPGGFDCSGLVQYAAGGAGIWVPRTALEQLRYGRPIARGDLRAGDLVFLHLKHKELHVGIALDGDRFVHAPSTGGYIRVDSLARAPYDRGFTAARRIVEAPVAGVQ